MQVKNVIPNAKRTENTRSALKQAARNLFITKGYAETGTPEIVKEAGVTRGALYHHYGDKRDLYREIVMDDLMAITSEIDKSGGAEVDPVQGLRLGSIAFISAMAKNQRAVLILKDGPSVLGYEELIGMEDETTRKGLREVLDICMKMGRINKSDLETMVDLLSAMFDRASLNIEGGADKEKVTKSVLAILDGLINPE